MIFFLEFVALMFGTATVFVFLSLMWYRMTQPDPIDRDTVIFFAKLGYGGAAAALLLALLLRIR